MNSFDPVYVVQVHDTVEQMLEIMSSDYGSSASSIEDHFLYPLEASVAHLVRYTSPIYIIVHNQFSLNEPSSPSLSVFSNTIFIEKL